MRMAMRMAILARSLITVLLLPLLLTTGCSDTEEGDDIRLVAPAERTVRIGGETKTSPVERVPSEVFLRRGDWWVQILTDRPVDGLHVLIQITVKDEDEDIVIFAETALLHIPWRESEVVKVGQLPRQGLVQVEILDHSVLSTVFPLPACTLGRKVVDGPFPVYTKVDPFLISFEK